mmetsp:Transcript_50981/g.103668  ORF Transcript_50981/g.103668 Transcript_50981/m.103668 type:complete len:207 (+) Transcript_50981:1245-1865(+)
MRLDLHDLSGGEAKVDGLQNLFYDVSVKLASHVPGEFSRIECLHREDDIHRICEYRQGHVPRGELYSHVHPRRFSAEGGWIAVDSARIRECRSVREQRHRCCSHGRLRAPVTRHLDPRHLQVFPVLALSPVVLRRLRHCVEQCSRGGLWFDPILPQRVIYLCILRDPELEFGVNPRGCDIPGAPAECRPADTMTLEELVTQCAYLL